MPLPHPDVDQVLELPASVERTVPPEFIDENGHMNIRHYLDLGAEGTIAIVADSGVDDDYRARRALGVFTAEHHLRYLAELRQGDTLSVHARALARSAKILHVMSFVLDRTHDRLAATVETTLIHVDLDTRRAVPFPADVADRLDATVQKHSGLAWPAPVSGVMGPRG